MAHRTKQDKPCAHTKQKHKHMASKTKSLAMCKTGHEHAANEKTHKPRVHTKHDKHESTQLVKKHKLRATQNKTKLEKARSWRTSCVQQNNTHGQRSARPERTRDRTLPQQDETWSVSVRTSTRNQNWAWTRQECRDPNTTLQHETEHADERARSSSTLKATRSPENKTRGECQGSVKKTPIN